MRLPRRSGISNNVANLIHGFLERLCLKDWTHAVNRKTVSRGHAELLKDRMRYSMTGLLLFYINRRQPDTYSAFVRLADGQLDAILAAMKRPRKKG